jgi:hypothetical protein
VLAAGEALATAVALVAGEALATAVALVAETALVAAAALAGAAEALALLAGPVALDGEPVHPALAKSAVVAATIVGCHARAPAMLV